MDLKGQKIKGEGVAAKQSDFAIYKLGDYLPWLLEGSRCMIHQHWDWFPCLWQDIAALSAWFHLP